MRASIKYLLELSPPQGNLRVRFLTLTIPNTPDPETGVRQLIESFRRLRQRKFWKETQVGGLYVIELTNKGKGWHAHLHLLVYGLFLPWLQLQRAWRAVSPGRGVYIKLTYGAPISIATYVTKYVTKTTLSEVDRREASRALKDARLFQVFGEWQHYGKPTRPAPVCPHCGKSEWWFDPQKFWKPIHTHLNRGYHDT